MKFISPSRPIQMAIALAINSEFKILLAPREIALKICYPKYEAHYTLAIALAISHQLGIEASQIAEKIAEKVTEAIAETRSQNPQIFAEWKIKSCNKGLLNIYLSERYLGDSLHALMSWKLDAASFEISGDHPLWQKRNISLNPSLNPSQQASEPMQQYAHARCCALIRLIDRTNQDSQYSARAATINKIHKIEPIEPEEVSLLLRNMAIADYLENENILPLDREKLSRSLAEAFLQFYDRCRIFGVDRYAWQRRSLLLQITQKFLVAIAPPEINYAMYL
ncbi:MULTISPECIES: DALR anticodon-binding domain-containing protein [Pseudanabaena]|uniref:DALR anticodon binding domain protein n=2 Tax=Pseudanabaena TaxID=1152 RepID=L8N3X2_9CYAN|nr:MULTISPECIES: DALR anticodon-binding domain-containing protein [Pseudanabaena]ELS34371.1 DALR anticodon binding domain protein [Pseudanabaena biceps PCC 7429]MDG3493423.1 DALR anticodon-binding domain-containing protein [Pseudanabaena catenata USMAC16]